MFSAMVWAAAMMGLLRGDQRWVSLRSVRAACQIGSARAGAGPASSCRMRAGLRRAVSRPPIVPSTPLQPHATHS